MAVGVAAAAALSVAALSVPAEAGAQQRVDTTAVLEATVRHFAANHSPLAVLVFRTAAGKADSGLRGAVVEAVPAGVADAIVAAPVGLRAAEPKHQLLFDQAAWIPIYTKYAGDLTLDSLTFTNASSARVHYFIRSQATPRPSRWGGSDGWVTLSATVTGRWVVQREEMETGYEGSFYPFTRPDLVKPESIRKHYAEARALLTARGIAVP